MFRKSHLPMILSTLALAAALGGLLGNGAHPVAADALLGSVGPAATVGTGFTYQGYLTRNGAPINGTGQCDMRFSLWDAASGGAQVGNLQTVSAVDFANGAFTVTLNDGGQFGPNAFTGAARWLQVELACPTGSASFSTVGRQAITSVPYASYSQSTGALQGQPISAAAPTSGQVLRWDGSAWAPATAYARTILVSPLATPAQSGAALLAALAAITDASATTPYLLKIEPGVYDLGTSSLQMKPYVDIEGSGEGVTQLQGARRADQNGGAINGADNAELRQLSVKVTSGTGAFAIAISISNASPHITHVTARSDGDTSYAIAMVNSARPRIEHVYAVATGGSAIATGMAAFANTAPLLFDVRTSAEGQAASYGLYASGLNDNTQGASIFMFGGIIEAADPGSAFAAYGVYANHGATVRLYNVRVAANHVGLVAESVAKILAGATQLDAFITWITAAGGTVVCASAYDGTFAPLNTACN